jgi:hypothetical protein
MGDKSLPYDVLKTSFHKLRFCNNPVCGRFVIGTRSSASGALSILSTRKWLGVPGAW